MELQRDYFVLVKICIKLSNEEQKIHITDRIINSDFLMRGLAQYRSKELVLQELLRSSSVRLKQKAEGLLNCMIVCLLESEANATQQILELFRSLNTEGELAASALLGALIMQEKDEKSYAKVKMYNYIELFLMLPTVMLAKDVTRNVEVFLSIMRKFLV